VNHDRFELLEVIARRTAALVAGGAAVLTLPRRSSHGEPFFDSTRLPDLFFTPKKPDC
jgi:hypothetical protein